MGKVVCPVCEKDDQIQKVMSIITNGSSTTQLDYRTATSTTHLASRLSPPQKPKSSLWGANPSGCSIWFAFLGYGVIIGYVFQLISGVDFFTSATPFTTGFFVGIAGVILFTYYDSQKTKKKIPDWEIQVARWSSLYYCYRDDCVFDPNTNKHTSPEGMNRLL